MANQVTSQNTSLTVPGITLPSGDNKASATIATKGPDAGYILGVKDSSLQNVSYSDVTSAYSNPLNVTTMNSALSLTPDGYAKEVVGVIPEPAFQVANTVILLPPGQTQGTAPQTQNTAPGSTNTTGTNSGKVYMLPVDMQIQGEGSQDHIRIKALKYRPPQGGNNGQFPALGDIVNGGIPSANAGLPPANYSYIGEVILPMPSEVRDLSTVSWGDTKMTPLVAGAIGPISTAVRGAAQGNIGGVISDTLQNAGGIANLFSAQSSDFREVVASSVSASLLQKTLGLQVEPSDILARTTGKVVNPNMELLFRSPNMRRFELQWKFTPRSKDEGAMVRKIIKFMKVNSLPYFEGKSQNLINSPNVFFIRYMNGNTRNKALPQPKICALVSFGIDHSSDGQGWAAFEDSQPISTVFTMTFSELTPLFKNETERDFPAEDDVGY
jgi:hypothetical protein